INLSTRGMVKTGEQVMIGGFIISGTTPLKVVVRGLGSSLIPPLSWNEVLHQAQIELHDSTGATIASNNGWQYWPDRAGLVATGLVPLSTLDSAMLLNLQPGAYTVILKSGSFIPSGVNDGIGLIEVDEIGVGP